MDGQDRLEDLHSQRINLKKKIHFYLIRCDYKYTRSKLKLLDKDLKIIEDEIKTIELFM